MLRLLTLIMLLCLSGIPAHAEDKIQYFPDGKIDYFHEDKPKETAKSSCASCTQAVDLTEMQKNDSAMKNKVEEINRIVQEKVEQKTSVGTKDILLFINPDCSYSDAAVKTLLNFKRTNPSWQIKGVFETSMDNFKEKIIQKKGYFTDGLEFAVDVQCKLAKQLRIDKVPAFLIVINNKYYKIAGQPDLESVIAKINQ